VRRGFCSPREACRSRTSGKPLRIETKFGQFVISERSVGKPRFAYAGGKIEAAIIRGSLTTEALDLLTWSSKGGTSESGERTIKLADKSCLAQRTPPNPISLSFPA